MVRIYLFKTLKINQGPLEILEVFIQEKQLNHGSNSKLVAFLTYFVPIPIPKLNVNVEN